VKEEKMAGRKFMGSVLRFSMLDMNIQGEETEARENNGGKIAVTHL
jgi:hypothetical protein